MIRNIRRFGFYFLIYCFVPLMNADTQNQTTEHVKEFLRSIRKPVLLTTEGAQACWSPDGNQLAYSYMPDGEDRAGGGGIRIRTLDSSKTMERITADGKDPAWSPDGKWIAYVRAGYQGMEETIWLVDADGEHELHFLCEGGYPQWMPDSKTLFFHSRKMNAVCRITHDQGNGKSVERLFELLYRYPRISPDGTRIAFLLPTLISSFRNHSDAKVPPQYLWMVSDVQQNVLVQKRVSFPFVFAGWSPDGTSIAFGTGENLAIIPSDFSKPICALIPGTWNRPAWSPDGQYLAYDNLEDGNLEIWISNIPKQP